MSRNMTFDAVNNTIILTRSFYEATKEFGSDAQMELDNVIKKYPNMNITVKPSRTSYRKNDNKGLTYDYMRRFIRVMDKENIITFEEVIAHYEEFGYESAQLYQCVKEWFLKTYPRHKEMIVDTAPKKVA